MRDTILAIASMLNVLADQCTSDAEREMVDEIAVSLDSFAQFNDLPVVRDTYTIRT